ncbi:hypothetical protein M6D93_16145 [Jatrophihabitans telluris]|uniref:Peptidase S11 D-alanyl-D-alanine carboxypeptidase A N-terminal domain-containing protein n=1 Tax=Jatrophihabitans telluris TaxID=2038343 RepID=A0ABY4QY60_9ACTN|nr:serine hydrolase [Jatrophihabitans telluris]UQX87819.1 hypothetical protein M6D93_16145 [Jatrophihabitans telluris]
MRRFTPFLNAAALSGLAAMAGTSALAAPGPAATSAPLSAPSATVTPTVTATATVTLTAPRPTGPGTSPQAPDPHPPAGGLAPDGSVPGGQQLARRGFILPAGAKKLPKSITAKAWVLSDLDTGEILAARDPHGRYQPASILKTLTAVTVLPHLPGSRVITVSKSAASAEGSAVGLLAGAHYSVDQLFKALFLVSGNDAAQALAEANGGVAQTVAQMNAEAARLGAYDTYVQTPSGLDGWQQLTSAYDMSLVLRAALANPRFLAYDQARKASYPPKRSRFGSVGGYEFDNQSADFLDGVPGALVAKTGYTDAALHTYICALQRGGRRLGIVFLRNQRWPVDQYQQAQALFEWALALPRSVQPVGKLAGAITNGPASKAAAPNPSTPIGSSPTPAEGHPKAARPDGATQATVVRPTSAAWLQRGALAAISVTVVIAAAVGAAGRRRLRRRSPRRR